MKFDWYWFSKRFTKEEYLALTNMSNLKCFFVPILPYSLNSEDVLIPLRQNCKKLECITFWPGDNFKFEVSGFDNFFKERQSTLKRLKMGYFELLDKNIFQNLYLCQNIEQLDLRGCFMSNEMFQSISQSKSLRTLKVENIPGEVLEIANWPALERLWIDEPWGNNGNDPREKQITD